MCCLWCHSNWLWVAHLFACVNLLTYFPCVHFRVSVCVCVCMCLFAPKIQLELLCYVRYVTATAGSFDCKDTLLSPSLLEYLLSLSLSLSLFLSLLLCLVLLLPSSLDEANPSKTHHRISGMDTRGMFAMCVLCFTRLPLSVFLPSLDDASFFPPPPLLFSLSSFPLATHSFHCTASGSTDWFNSTTLWPLLL